ncbi:RIMS-binding protein 2-like isoform X2 [Anneissia japonica]|uniref:RIMS-binding protein 2-like isoform X2 n=1 Tax=Anneissia japonica TaxID=1529436 RepID=UPI001425956E|nr:RIMS-binding protein 2-like isoform X2 [Anneissia japonica]
MLERQFPTSVIISWSHPNTSRTSMIREYKIYVNGVPKTTVQGKVKTMLLDSIDQDMTYRISVRTLTAEGMSDEAACTIMIGKGASASPTRLKASHVTPDSADITWLPGNSNHSHVISVNGREMITVKPGRHQYSFAGLSPSSVYRVRVTAKPKHTTNDNLKKHSAEIEFKTLPGGLPEPPLDVQIKPGSLPGTLEVEWLPVTITTSGLSNGAVVMGYAVFANEYKVASTPSPTVDRLVLHIDKLRALGATHLVVRTLSPNGFSADSSKVRLPQHLLQTSTPLTTQQSEIIRFLYSPSVRVSRYRKRYQPHHFWCKYRGNARSNMYENASDDDSQSSRTTSEDSHPEVFAKNGAVKMVNTPQTSNDVKKKSDLEYQSESDRSELSDIAEEAEEELSDFESGDLPGLSDSIEKSWQDEQFKNVKETLEHNAKLESEFDETDPEVEQLNKPNHAVPIQIIRQQRDYERESDLSPHNQVLEPVPVKPKQTDLQISVPQIEITKDCASDVVTSSMSEQYSDHEFDHPRNGAAAANPSMREKAQTRKQSLDSGSEWEDSRKDYDSKNINRQSLEKSQKSSQDTYSTDPEELYDDSTVRTFVALYDYDPESMSPNDDGVDEELAFHEGDLIKIYGDKDADGFYIGELNGKRGFVPYNMVQETQTNSEEPHTKPPRNQSSEPTTGELIRTDTNSTPQEYQSPVNGHQSSSSQKEVERCMLMRAIFDYDPSVSSPNPDIENELSFQQGELITVYGDMDEDGFFMGEANGERGLVPSNFLEEASDPGLNGSAGSPAPSTGGYSLNSFDRSPTTKDSQQDLGRQSSIGSTVSKQSNGFDQVSQTSMDDPKKKKGLLSKGKALFKKFGGGDSGNKKKK